MSKPELLRKASDEPTEDDIVKKYEEQGMTPEVIQDLENYLNDTTSLNVTWSDKRHKFVVDHFDSLAELIELKGNRVVKDYFALLNNDDFAEAQLGTSSEDMISEMLHIIPQNLLSKVVKELESNDDFNTDEDDNYDYLANYISKNYPDMEDKFIAAWTWGYEVGNKNEVLGELFHAVKDAGYVAAGSNIWGPYEQLVSVEEVIEELKSGGSVVSYVTNQKVTIPYAISLDNFDEKAALDYLGNLE